MNPWGRSRKTSRAWSSAWARASAKRSPATRTPLGDHGVVDGGEGFVASGRVVAESLDVEQAPVGGEADLAECGQVGQSFPDVEVVGVVDGGLGP